MSLVRGSVWQLTQKANQLQDQMEEEFVRVIGQRPSESEKKSWQQSIPFLLDVLKEAELSNLELFLEYRLPLSSKRIDALIAGQNAKTGENQYLVVELKQWSDVELWDDAENLVIGPGFHNEPRLHPAVQVDGYVDYLRGFLKIFENTESSIEGISYLHNLDSLVSIGLPKEASSRVFSRAEKGALQDSLRNLFAKESGARAADELQNSAVAPSRQLMKLVSKQLKDRDQFVLVDSQRLAVDVVKHAVLKGIQADSKQVVLVSGGPGSGKSVVALSLLAELASMGRTAIHATGSKSFTLTIRDIAGKKSSEARNIFKYFNNFMDAEKNGLDVLIMDEAHRIRKSSVTRFTAAKFRTDRSQLDEVMNAARVPVFLLDENQVVRPGEMGSIAEIEAHAMKLGLRIVKIDLNDQFRCAGSAEYVRWVETLLGISDEPRFVWSNQSEFALEMVESPTDLENYLAQKIAQGYGARMTAGFCWPWSDMKNGELIPDVVIGDWHRPWNSKADRKVGDVPPSSLWATDPGGFGQVGCIYTAQGFEYDWNGVIFGDDLVIRQGKWVVNRQAIKDGSLNKAGLIDDELLRLLKNVYKVLLTRGMIGTVIYSTDSETQEYLNNFVQA